MDTGSTWEAFTDAQVSILWPDGTRILRPDPTGAVSGAYPFDATAHIVTAYNPNGELAPKDENEKNDTLLGEWLAGLGTYRTVSSAPDGSFAEPGYLLVGLPSADVRSLGIAFGQLAVYKWSAEALHICAVGNDRVVTVGWSLT